METVLIQIKNSEAYKHLKSLEDLDLLKVLGENSGQRKTLSEKYAGKLPSDIASKLQDYVSQSRNEWNQDI